MEIQKITLKCRAFTLLELALIVIAIVLLAVSFFPVVIKERQKRINTECINNLKQTTLAFKIWCDNDNKYPQKVPIKYHGVMEFAENGIAFPIFQAMSNEVYTPKILICPADTNHFIATNFTTDFDNSKISYFVGLDATIILP